MDEKLVFKDNDLPDVMQVIDLYDAIGWGKKEDYNIQKWELILKNTTRILTVYATDTLIGMSRVLSDNHHDTQILEIIVHPEFRKNHIGKKMVEKITELYAHTSIYMSALKENEAFFEKCGIPKQSRLTCFALAPQS